MRDIIYILDGIKLTLLLTLITAIFAFPLGIILALIGISKNKIVSNIIQFYNWIFRGTPLLLQLFFVYYGLPVFGITLSPFTAATLTFVINYSAHICEIFRGSILGIDKGQYEAAKVLGFTYSQTMKRIILPQTLITSLPPLSNEIISLIKSTSLIAVIGMSEILRHSKEIVSRSFTVFPFFICALIYLLIAYLLILMFKKIEKKVII